MEPISTAIVAAIAVGVAAGTTDVSKNALVDTYNGLKGLIQKKFGKSELPEAVKKLEQNPESKGRLVTLQEEVKESGADKDEDILKLVQELMNILEKMPEGQKNIAKYQVDARGAQVGVIGDHAEIKDGIVFGSKK